MFTAKQILGKVAITIEEDYWSRFKCYDKLVIVEKQDSGLYISRKPVPPLVDITNRHYWIPFNIIRPESQGSDVTIVQTTGNDTSVVMSQAAVTAEINRLEQLINRYHPAEFNHNVDVSPTRIFSGILTPISVIVTTENNQPVDNINVVVTQNGTGTWHASENNTNRLAFGFNTRNACTVTVTITKGGVSISKDISITERQSINTLQFYLGLGQDTDDVVNNSSNAHFIGSNNSIIGNYSIVPYGENEYNYLYLIVPQEAEYNRVVMTYAVTFEELNSITLNGNTYKVYRSVEEIENSNYNLVIE